MIPAPDTLVDIDNLPGEEIEFGIGDPCWVMKTQADLYSDIITAIIREYSTNAYDAHVMAGNPDPIEVTLPSPLNPLFVVEDKGVGMDIQTFRKIYTQFGISDKRESMVTNGMLGYGSKSGIAYTTQFTVTSVKDGVRIEGIVKRKPDWRIVLKVISQKRTDEPNGTRITIPVPNNQIAEFAHKANEFYKFWLPGRVRVNGKDVVHFVGNKIADNLYYSKQWGTSYVVMGNVPYRIANPDALFRNTKMNRLNFVAYVDDFKTEDGAAPVEFTPSREDLKYTERTKNTLQAIINRFETDIVALAQQEISKATSHADAFLAWKKWVDTLGRDMFSDLTYKGDKLEPEFSFRGHRYETRSYRYNTHAIRSWGVDSMKNTMVVTEFDIAVSSDVKRKAKEYARLKDWNHSYILFTADKADDIKSVWIKRDQFVRWEDLKTALPKKPKRSGGNNYYNNPNAGRLAGSWDYAAWNGTHYGWENEKPLPKATSNVYYISVKQEKNFDVRSLMRALDLQDAVVLLVPANRLGKLLRENPSITEFIAYAKSKVVTDGSTLLTDEGKEVMDMSHETRQWISKLDVTRVNDPKVVHKADLLKRETELLKRYNNNLSLARLCKMWYDVKEYTGKDNDYMSQTYPLLAAMTYRRVIDHVYIYLNAAYAAESEKKNVK